MRRLDDLESVGAGVLMLVVVLYLFGLGQTVLITLAWLAVVAAGAIITAVTESRPEDGSAEPAHAAAPVQD